MHPELPSQVRSAIASDLTIDIVAKVARSGLWRAVEIWYTRIEDRIVICGTPGSTAFREAKYQPRNWLVNMKANPYFWFCLKESIQFCIPAKAKLMTSPHDRRLIMSHEATCLLYTSDAADE